MKILYLTDYYYPFEPGGAEVSIRLLAKGLFKKVKLKVLTLNAGLKKNTDSVVLRMPFIFKLKSRQNQFRFYVLTNPFYYLYTAFWTIYYLKKLKIEIVHIHSKFMLPGAVIAKFFTGVRLVYTIRDNNLFCPLGICLQKDQVLAKDAGFLKFWRYCLPRYIDTYHHKNKSLVRYLSLLWTWIDLKLRRFCLQFCDKYIFVSKYLRDLHITIFPQIAKRSSVIYDPIQTKNLKIDNDFKNNIKKIVFKHRRKTLILYVGRVTKGKGVGLLIDACKKIYRKNKNFMLLLAGVKTSFKLPNKSFVHYFGSLTPSELNVLYEICDFVVIPSLVSEPFGRVPLEAAMFKKPVIATMSGGLKETVKNNFNGLLIARNDVFKLTEAIKILKENSKLRKKLGQNNFRHVLKSFSVERISRVHFDVYDRLSSKEKEQA
ncbi:glycosyltransferase family 4 protein [Patescibacteria group bacterium]